MPLRIACALAALLVWSPGLAAPLEVSAEPASVLLGAQSAVRIHVRAPGRAGELQWLVPAGELVRSPAPAAASADVAEFSWTPPSTRIPQVVLVVFWLANDPRPPEVGVARLVLVGQLDLEVNTDPGALVRVQVAEKTFGPRRADGRGHVKVPIEVPPTAREAKVLGEVKGKAASAVSVPLDVPRVNPLAAFVSPDPLVAGQPGWLWIFDASAQTGTIELSAKGTGVRPERSENDRMLYRLTPESARRVTLNVRVRNAPEATLQLSSAVVKEAPAPQSLRTGAAAEEDGVGGGLIPSALLGGFYGGGANLGPTAGLGVGLRLPWWDGRLIAELELGLREVSFSTSLAGLGTLDSTLWALPISVGARGRLLESGPWSVDARLGGGPMPVLHSTRSSFQPAYSESGLVGLGFAALTAGYRVSTFELFTELRGQWSPVGLPHLSAQPGGLGLSVGVRQTR